MKKIATLKKNYEFRKVLNKGQAYFGKHITVYIKQNGDLDENLLGIAINSKLCNAVKRNRIKRLIRENYAQINKFLKKGNSIVFIINKNVEVSEITYYTLKKDMEKIFKKAKLFI